MQTHAAVEQNKTLNGPRVHRISPVGKEKIRGRKDLPKSEEKPKLGSSLPLLSVMPVVAFPAMGHYCLDQYRVIVLVGSCDVTGNGIAPPFQ